jgi:hypothetical protein
MRMQVLLAGDNAAVARINARFHCLPDVRQHQPADGRNAYDHYTGMSGTYLDHEGPITLKIKRNYTWA